ncbi:MaoC family dehydratase [Ornithinimicrobium cavernae]|uniref:MaoC family dehydratase n=1 Tax=Ornithinimicrobium cavernae TaxID=2666047 RepID=UPI000D696A69|nr:MaoC/PaaZ C-terminal domain-containing protein [Ornithinimicrobium cavernae]
MTVPASAQDIEVELLEELPSIGREIARALVPTRRGGPDGSLPDRRVMVTDLVQDADRFAAYSRVCGFTLRDTVPATWLHVLTFPLQVHLMASADFPLALPGLVHVSNRMRLHRPVGVGEAVTLSSSAADLRAHGSGTQVDLLGEARVGDEVVWTGRSTYLARGKRPSDSPAQDATGPDLPKNAPEAVRTSPRNGGEPSALWRLGGGLGREYAAVSGDVNPIHLTPLTARAFGFPRTIAHGMWVHARTLAALEGRLPAVYEAAVEFRKPVLLPSTVGFSFAREGGGLGLCVTDRAGSRVHLTGSVT